MSMLLRYHRIERHGVTGIKDVLPEYREPVSEQKPQPQPQPQSQPEQQAQSVEEVKPSPEVKPLPPAAVEKRQRRVKTG